MSVETKNMWIKAGELYVSNARIGNLKNVNVVYTKTFADAVPGDSANVVRRDLLKETVVMTGTLCDIKQERIPMLMGLTMSTTQLTNTSTLRITQEIQLPATNASSWKTLSATAVSTTNPVVYSLDYQTKAIDGIDYSLTTTSGQKTKLHHKSSSFASKYLLVSYDYVDKSALVVRVGGKTTHEEKKVKFVHVQSDGKRFQITIPKAQITGEFSLAFNEDKHIEIPVSFTGIADMTLAKGRRLFSMIQER